MALTSADILTEIRIEIGDLNGTTYSDTTITDTFVPAGLNIMKGKWLQEYSVDGDGNFSPDAGSSDYNDRRAIVLHSALAVMRIELTQAAREATYHSSPAGSTELRARFDALKARTDQIKHEIDTIYSEKVREQFEDNVEAVKIRRSSIAYSHD